MPLVYRTPVQTTCIPDIPCVCNTMYPQNQMCQKWQLLCEQCRSLLHPCEVLVVDLCLGCSIVHVEQVLLFEDVGNVIRMAWYRLSINCAASAEAVRILHRNVLHKCHLIRRWQMFDAGHAHQGQCLCCCSAPATCVLICGKVFKIHTSVVRPNVPCVLQLYFM